MIVAGIDLAASPLNTAMAVLDGARVREVVVGVDDDTIVDALHDVTKIGIDCPLGWPQAFVDFINAQAAGADLPPAGTVADRAPLTYRVTDLRVARDHPPLRPLSVSADRIAHAAFRCAPLFARLDPTRDRSGHGRIAETYPAGSLFTWDLPYRGYKGTPGSSVREQIITGLSGIVDIGEHRAVCLASDHALDAVVAALSAAATAAGAATLPVADEHDVARAEGWITLPTCTLDILASILNG